jgi:hypothetical protein
MNVPLDVLLLIDCCSCRVLSFMAAQWRLHFWYSMLLVGLGRKPDASNEPEKLTRLYFYS